MGGAGSSPSLRWAAAEMFLGANPGTFLYMSGPGFATILDRIGNDDQKRWGQLIVDKEWGATMVLTEPDAGSDVGAGRTKAYPNEDGTWRIEGVKRFITSAEHDMTDNIVHLVLARPVGVEGVGGPGTKGLSLFLVPKYHVDLETGELGDRNGVYATNVEKKMGLKVSTTCELTFGEKEPAIGWLVGDVHEGIAQMFMVIENARMMVGTKAIAQLSAGYMAALDYAKTRVQGATLPQMMDKTAPRVTIMHHPDVRRGLMLQKSYVEGMRALIHYTAMWQDQILMAKAGVEGIDLDMAERVNDLLLPIVKGVGSERSYELLSTSLQTFGGSGYLQDYPVEQYIRDAKIDTLYEGTTAIQGLDFFFRKMVRDQFKAIFYLASQITETVKGDAGNGVLAGERELLGKALEDVQGIIAALGGWAMASQENPDEIYRVGLNTTRLLMASGDLVIGWLLLRQAEVALAALEAGATGKDKDFYEGKVVTAKWFAQNRLPLLAAERAVAEATDDAIMSLPEEAF
jgi:alkylation response protein AidB-like acyl-CoA dehydrogenase